MNLLKLITIAIILSSGCDLCYAQQVSFRGGLNLSQFRNIVDRKFAPRDNQKFNIGFNAGPIIDLYLKNMFSLETGILFSAKGNKYFELNKHLWQENMYYLELPVMLKASKPINKNADVFAMAGGYVAEALYGNRKGYGWNVDIGLGSKDNEYDRLDYGLKFGAGIKIHRVQLGACFEVGLIDFENHDDIKDRTRVMEFYLAYQLKEWNQKKRNHFEKRMYYPVSVRDGGKPRKR
jgi:hypothetical protein